MVWRDTLSYPIVGNIQYRTLYCGWCFLAFAELLLLDVRAGLRGKKGGTPGCLEIKSAGFAVDVQHLARKIKSLCFLALHSRKIDFLQLDTPAGYKLLLKSGFPLDRERALYQVLQQFVYVFFAGVSSYFVFGNLREVA